MQRNDRDPNLVENPDTKTYKNYKETKYTAGENKDMMSQLLMWVVPLLLIGFLGYYLYRTYYGTPSIKITPTTTTAPATPGISLEKTATPSTSASEKATVVTPPTDSAVEKAAKTITDKIDTAATK